MGKSDLSVTMHFMIFMHLGEPIIGEEYKMTEFDYGICAWKGISTQRALLLSFKEALT